MQSEIQETKNSGSSSSSSSSSSGSESESGSASEDKATISKSLFESDNSDEGKVKDSAHLYDSDDDDEETEGDEPEMKRLTSRRKTAKEIKESMEINPDVYGVRRSSRSRKEPTRYTEQASDSESEKLKGKRRGRRKISNDTWGEDSEGSSDASTDSDSYQPSHHVSRRSALTRLKRGRGRPSGRKKHTPTYSDSEEENSKRTTSLRATAKSNICYKEDSDAQTDPDDIIEQTEEQVREQEEVDSRETIEGVLKHRLGLAHAVGSKTTLYNVEENGDPNNDNKDANNVATDHLLKNERIQQYLIKWKGWSYLHCTWESEESLDKRVNGMKKLENYKKRQDEIDYWKTSATPEEIEYFDCQNEMMSDLLQCYLLVDRIIDHSNQKGLTHPDYYLKWQGLPYADCTWESGDLITRRFQSLVEAYHDRNESLTIPSKLCKALKVRPKFQPLTTQPDFIGEKGTYELRDYQLEGLNWLIQSWSKYNSVILADEMGLGKTIQVISFLSYLANTYQLYGPFLIVVPLSTIVAWQREFRIWAPEMNVVTYLGDLISRNKIREYEFYQPGNKRIKFNALVTTYEILLKDKTELGSFNWAMLLVDEAHRLKNDDSLLYRSLKDFNSNHRLLITGTPLQNSLKELWSLLHFIMPDKFDSWDEFEETHSKSESQCFSGLHKELQPFLLRRVKKDVEKSLPAKVEQILRVEMSSIQKQYSRWILAKNYKALSKGVKGSIVGFINIMMELKKCCNHAFITRPQDNRCSRSSDQLQAVIRGSGKMLLLDKLLCRLKEKGHRVLIFSQMVRMLDIIADYLKLKQFQFQRLDGSIRGDLRKQALDHFNAEGSQDFCFLLSTRAGGLGVNLATADTVIIFDSDWNPQNDLQAQARAHRIGQKNQVSVYRLVCKNSVEETIVEKAKRKMVLDHLIIQRMDTTGRTILNRDKSSNNTPFNKEELSQILKFGAEDLFKEGDADDEEPQVDIDDILMRAETRENEQSSVGDDLLSNFKIVSFENLEAEEDKKQMNMDEESVDKDWDDIIPEDTRRKVDEEERQKQLVELHLPPRSRKTIQQLEKEYDSDGDKRSKKREEDEDSESSDDEEEDKPKRKGRQKGANKEASAFTSMEVRKFIKSYKKFANPFQRLDAIACDAELQEKSEAELRELAELIKVKYEETIEVYKAQQLDEQLTEGKKSQRGPTFKIANVTVNAATLAKTMDDMSPLAYLPVNKDERKKYTMNCHVKDVHWDCEWGEEDDTNLIRGVYEYGMGNWEQIKMDLEFNLQHKILPGTATKPQAKHLQTRMEYLLRVLKKVSEIQDCDHPKKMRKKKKPPKSKAIVNEKDGILDNNGDLSNLMTNDASNIIADTARKKRSKKKSAEFVDSQDSDVHDETDNVNDENMKTRHKKRDPTLKHHLSQKKRSEVLHITAKSQPVPVGQEDEGNLSSTAFARCKEQMRPVKKALKQLDNPEEGLSEKETVRHVMQCLLTIGDRISKCLTRLADPDDIKQLRSDLWIFVSHFTDFEPNRLHKMYKHALRKRDSIKPSQKESMQVKRERTPKLGDTGGERKITSEDQRHRHHYIVTKEDHGKEHHDNRSKSASHQDSSHSSMSSHTSRSTNPASSRESHTHSTSPTDRWTHSSPLVRAEQQQNRFNNNSPASKGSSFRKYRTYPGSEPMPTDYNNSYQRYNNERPREIHQYNRNDPRDYRYPPPDPVYSPFTQQDCWPHSDIYSQQPHSYTDARYSSSVVPDRKRKAEGHERYSSKDRKLQAPYLYPPH